MSLSRALNEEPRIRTLQTSRILDSLKMDEMTSIQHNGAHSADGDVTRSGLAPDPYGAAAPTII